MPAPVPMLEETPGHIDWAGPESVGSHTREVLHDILGFDENAIDALADKGVI
jgi:crotonobetainyl-CoA:carnitine CoA-transferase CaiB-like acyl-CoA transferase